MANEMIEVERISDLAEGQYNDNSWIVIDTGTVVVKLKLKDAVPDATTESKGKVQLSDSTGTDSSTVAATSKAVKLVNDALLQAVAELSGSISEKYTRPSSGIPASDLASSVQTSLQHGDSALEKLSEIGQPLVWKGAADVSTLNGTIEGLTNGWTYTLTDSGKLSAGSVSVQSGDEVAWTGNEWFKLGGEGGIKIFKVEWSEQHSKYIYPEYAEITAVVDAGVLPVLHKQFYKLQRTEYYVFRTVGQDNSTNKSVCSFDNNALRISIDEDGTVAEDYMGGASIAPEFDASMTYSVGSYVMYQGILWRCVTAVETAGSWDSNSWEEASVSDTLPPKAGANQVLVSDSDSKIQWGSTKNIGIDDESMGMEDTFTGLIFSSKIKPGAIAVPYDEEYTGGFPVGSYTVYDGLLYRNTSEIASGTAAGSWDGSKWTSVSISSIVGDVESVLASL